MFTYLSLENSQQVVKHKIMLQYNMLFNNSDEIEAEEALAIIEENPTNFGVWDRVLDPTSAKVRVEKMMKRRSSSQQMMENEIKQLELNEKRKAKDESDLEEEETEKEVKEPPFRNLVSSRI